MRGIAQGGDDLWKSRFKVVQEILGRTVSSVEEDRVHTGCVQRPQLGWTAPDAEVFRHHNPTPLAAGAKPNRVGLVHDEMTVMRFHIETECPQR